MKFDWLLLFHFNFDWPLKKGCDLEQKNGAIREQIVLLRVNQIATITSDFKMGVIKQQIVMIKRSTQSSLISISVSILKSRV